MSLLLTAAWLWMMALSGSAELHGAVHADAAASAHHCAVTDLAHGQADAPAPACSVVVWSSVPLQLPLPSSLPAPPSIDRRLDPGRAPPA